MSPNPFVERIDIKPVSPERLAYIARQDREQTPSMRAGFVIQTSYGDIAIDAADAGPFADLLDAIITEELREVV